VFTKAAARGLFDELRLWDNSGSAPELIARATSSAGPQGQRIAGGLEVFDEAAYARFLAKI
jgi:hypothetical protein